MYIECHHYCSLCIGPSNDRTNCTQCLSNPGIHPTNSPECFCSPNKYWERPKDAILYPGEFTCEPCHKLCLNCFGSTVDDCILCDFTLRGVVQVGNSCYCDANNGYYLDGNGDCLPCHKYCKMCLGPTQNECSNCVLSPAIVFQAPDICRCRTDGPFFEDTTDILNPICSRIY